MGPCPKLRPPPLQVSDLAPLSPCTALTQLACGNSGVDSLAPLAGCTQLRRLACGDAQLRDLGPLAGLTQVAGCPVVV